MMAVVEKILGIVTIGNTLVNASLLHRYLSEASGIIVLTITTTLMGCVLLIGVLFGTYSGLVSYGFTSTTAAFVVMSVVFVMTLVLTGITIARLRRLKNLHSRHSALNIPGAAQIGGIIEAFIDGVLSGPRSPRK